ncbi:MAG: methylmalonyl Co-A mutase-associated GTPase MeaB [Flavobacteriales bacterium]|nr:methylmalonyl Co-A mutase-associated GTPase MeaB [Flavobacteriales bacterium]|tara:strand:+ start:268 stop:1221 length:954 start_codon:yes stop_codon:yes gene_type:complete
MKEKTIIKNIKAGDTIALSKAITLCESTLEREQNIAQNIIATFNNEKNNSIRIGITGVPGVGKSTFINSFGKMLTNLGKKVAVLAIDPTSEKSQGSILGDKSRMDELATDKNAFIRPSPAGRTLGGVADKTRESIILCEASGFDVILIETVGVGQSETTVSNLVDFFLLLMLSGAGDELQGIKRGIMEMADAILINKADGDNVQNANNAMLQYKSALHLFPANANRWKVEVNTCSGLEEIGLEEIWETIEKHNSQMKENSFFTKNREEQNIYWLHSQIKEELGNKKYSQLKTNGELKKLEEKLQNKGTTIYQLLETL